MHTVTLWRITAHTRTSILLRTDSLQKHLKYPRINIDISTVHNKEKYRETHAFWCWNLENRCFQSHLLQQFIFMSVPACNILMKESESISKNISESWEYLHDNRLQWDLVHFLRNYQEASWTMMTIYATTCWQFFRQLKYNISTPKWQQVEKPRAHFWMNHPKSQHVFGCSSTVLNKSQHNFRMRCTWVKAGNKQIHSSHTGNEAFTATMKVSNPIKYSLINWNDTKAGRWFADLVSGFACQNTNSVLYPLSPRHKTKNCLGCA